MLPMPTLHPSARAAASEDRAAVPVDALVAAVAPAAAVLTAAMPVVLQDAAAAAATEAAKPQPNRNPSKGEDIFLALAAFTKKLPL